MYIACFALLSLVGAWAAWRRNPMYTARSTVRVGLAVLLMMAAQVALVVLAVHLAMKQSKSAGMAIIFGTVAVAAMGMIYGIIKLTRPAVAALPSAVKMVDFHQRKVGVWAKRWIVSMLAVGVLALLLPGATKGIAYALGAIVGLLGVVMLFAGYYSARNQDRALTALEYHPWVHWQYSPAQWAAWIDAQVARAQAVPPDFVLRRDWWKLAPVCLAVGAGIFAVGAGWIFTTLCTVAISGLLAAILISSRRSASHLPETVRARLTCCTPEAYLGDEGLFCDGTFMPWVSTDDWLLEARVDHGAPPNLLFRFEKINPGNTSMPTSKIDQRVLLPEAAESDLATLQAELRAKCPAARVTIFG